MSAASAGDLPDASSVPGSAFLSRDEGQRALSFSREVLRATAGRRPLPPAPDDPAFRLARGCFVSLHAIGGALRACVGTPEPVRPLGEAIADAARAACIDPRFPPLSLDEFPNVLVELSVLSALEPVSLRPETLAREVVVGRHGLLVESDGARGLLLPQVPVEMGWDAEAFVAGVLVKAGLPADAWWARPIRFLRFTSETHAEARPEDA